MSSTTPALLHALDRLDLALEHDLVVRSFWTRTEADGRKLACLLATLAPECGAAKSPIACPTGVLPAWLACLIPWIDDAGSAERWPELVRRFAAALRRCASLDAEAWRRLDYRCRFVALREALAHAGEARGIVERVLALCERAGRGEHVAGAEWEAAERSAWDTAEEAAAAWEATVAAKGKAAVWMVTMAWAAAAAKESARAVASSASAAAGGASAVADAADRIIEGVCAELEGA